MIKRLMSLMCALIMICSCCAFSRAVAEEEQQITASNVPSDLFVADEESGGYYYVQDMVAVGNTIYATAGTDGGYLLSYWRPGMTSYANADMHEYTIDGETKSMSTMVFASSYSDASQLEGLMDSNGNPIDGTHAVGTLFTDGTRLMTVNPLTGLVFEIKVDENGAVSYSDIVTLNDTTAFFHVYDDDSGDRYAVTMNGMVVENGKLYFNPNDWDDSGNPKATLYIADLTTGEVTASSVKNVVNVTAYKDGKLAVRIYDQENSYNSETDTMDYGTVEIYDPATDSTQVYHKFENYVNNLFYCDTLDVLFYQDTTKLVGIVNGAEKQIGYVPVDYTSAVAVAGKTFIAYCDSQTVVRDMDLNFNSSLHLTIGNMGYMDDGAKLFSEQNPNVAVYYDNDYYSDVESIGQAMVNGDNSVDIFVMNVSYSTFTTLMKKGYCADLSSYTTLTDSVSRMYPVFSDAVTLNGKLYAIPTEVYSSGWTYDQSVLEAVGLTADELPTNLVELCEFITRWNDEFVDEYPEYWIFDNSSSSLKKNMLTVFMEEYVNWCTSQGKDVTFDTTEFRTLMKAWESIECDQIDKAVSDDMSNDNWRSALITNGYSTVGDFSWLQPDSTHTYAVHIPMSLTADTEEVFGAKLTVMFINPNTTNMDAAVKFLTCELEAMSDTAKHTFYTDETEPVRNSYYDQLLENEQEYVASLKKQLEEADDADKSWIQEMITTEENYIANTLPNEEYDITAEAIQKYQSEVVSKVYIVKPTFTSSTSSSNATSELNDLVSRYRDGQITLDQFIREADNKMRMMRMEDE